MGGRPLFLELAILSWLSFEVQESLTKPALGPQVLDLWDFNFIGPRWSILLHAAYRSAAGEPQNCTREDGS
jgi:hypothetical protein